jgi:hypothetical protein
VKAPLHPVIPEAQGFVDETKKESNP